MTAFAALLRHRPIRTDTVSTMAEVIGRVTGRPATTTGAGPCVFVHSPIHDDTGMALAAGAAVAGTAVLEDRLSLARQLNLGDTASAIHVAAAARERYGARVTDRLSGEFALAGWDARRRVFWCARDGLGVRLAYVAEGADAVIVSNVLEAIVASGLADTRPDDAALAQFLAYGYVVDPARTPYRGIGVLPAGHTLEIREGRASLHRHWRLPAPPVAVRRDAYELREEYRECLGRAVEDRLARSVTSILLSGGIDSATIAAAACVQSPRPSLHAITIAYDRFASPVPDDPAVARRVAAALGIPVDVAAGDRHDPMEAERTGTVSALLLDEPALADWRGVLAGAAARSTVALFGEDGDAVFAPPGGRALLRNMNLFSLSRAALSFLRAQRRRPYLAVRGAPEAASPVPSWLSADARALLDACEPRLTLGCASTPLPPHPTRPRTQARLSEGIVRALAESVSPEVTLQRLEVRLPLLDSRVLACVFAAPPIPWCQQKALARLAYDDVLPPDVVRRPKTPVYDYFDLAVRAWRARAGCDLQDVAVPGVDMPVWRSTIAHGSPLDVAAGWRVLHVAAWLSRSAVPSTACIT